METHKDKTGIDNTTKFYYNASSDITKIEDNDGNCIKIEYDVLNRVIRKIDQNGDVERRFYNKNGDILKIVKPNQYDENTDSGTGIQFIYDIKGRIKSIVSPTNKVLETRKYDANDNIISKIMADGSGIDTVYNVANREKTITTKNGSSQTYKYDARGNITGIIDGNSNETNYILDKWGRIIQIVKADESVEKYRYDYAGNISQSTDGNGNITVYEYNDINKISKIVDAEFNSEKYTYDAMGRVANKLDKNGNETRYEYNMYDNLIVEKAIGDSLYNKYIYDKKGQLEQVLCNKMMYNYSYDKVGRLSKKMASGRALVQYEYDKNGNTIKQIDTKKNITEYKHNVLDLVENIYYNKEEIAKYNYTDSGILKSISNGNLSTNYDYDLDRNITNITTRFNGKDIINNNYNYDNNGNILEKMGLNGKTTYNYDALNQLQKAKYPTFSEELFYDKGGNRVKRLKDIGTSKIEEEVYHYDNRNRLIYYEKNKKTYGFEYDKVGNLLKDDKANYIYDNFNRTSVVKTFDEQVQINRYDPEYLRHEVVENGKIVKFIYNKNREVITESTENKETTYIRTSELIASSNDHDKTYYHYASDEMGSITHIVDNKKVLNEYEYDAWGNVTSSTETIENRFKFNGQQLDPITEQYYLRARYYNPVIGRFTQEDTYRGDGLNLYAYCGNNPVSYVDPTGFVKLQ